MINSISCYNNQHIQRNSTAFCACPRIDYARRVENLGNIEEPFHTTANKTINWFMATLTGLETIMDVNVLIPFALAKVIYDFGEYAMNHSLKLVKKGSEEINLPYNMVEIATNTVKKSMKCLNKQKN